MISFSFFDAVATLARILQHCLRGIPVLALLLLSACASSGEPALKEQSKLDLVIEAGSDVNPDEKSRAAPLMVRIYELKSDAAFQEADFFSLQSSDKVTLGSDLLAKDEYILRPGDNQAIRRKSSPSTEAIGVLAAYRDLPNSNWRVVYKLPPAPEAVWYRSAIPANKIKLHIKLESNAIKLTEMK
ncbi:type VI secretion system lipoprotein TssJ [Collimonas silvisoli]|uniref:type VI secretion system lipoprotein TssJ n=1 Tax=Collimonas silvisoli TaxID=2825884 RepID=UPI001B8C50CB|nr:type VI secretion system lipoprotein TssJ [Collimonas silvisoli]